MTRKFPLSRRTFLRGTAGSAIALPLLEAMSDRKAHAAAPPRLLIMVNVHGTFPERFWPLTPGQEPFPADRKPAALYSSGSSFLDTTSYTLPSISAPLAKHKSRITFIEGLDIVNGQEGHRNLGAMLTNREPVLIAGRPYGTGISFDLAIAAKQTTRIPSLHLGATVGERTITNGALSWYGSEKPAPAQNSPAKTFEALFGASGAGGAGGERLRVERQAVLDGAIQQVADLKRVLGVNDRQKLDAYLTSVSEVQQRLSAGVSGSCKIPAAPTAKDVPAVGQANMDLAIAAFQCDLTRVATLQYYNEGSAQPLPWLGYNEPAHTISHAGNSDLAGYQKIEKIHHFYATQFSLLLDKLAAVPENGGTMLDNTLVLWAMSMTKGNEHHNWNIPTVLAGNINGTYKMGRYLRLARDPAKRYSGRNKFVRGHSFGDLGVTIMRSFGMKVDSFGDPYYNTEPLDRYLKA